MSLFFLGGAANKSKNIFFFTKCWWQSGFWLVERGKEFFFLFLFLFEQVSAEECVCVCDELHPWTFMRPNELTSDLGLDVWSGWIKCWGADLFLLDRDVNWQCTISEELVPEISILEQWEKTVYRKASKEPFYLVQESEPTLAGQPQTRFKSSEMYSLLSWPEEHLVQCEVNTFQASSQHFFHWNLLFLKPEKLSKCKELTKSDPRWLNVKCCSVHKFTKPGIRRELFKPLKQFCCLVRCGMQYSAKPSGMPLGVFCKKGNHDRNRQNGMLCCKWDSTRWPGNNVSIKMFGQFPLTLAHLWVGCHDLLELISVSVWLGRLVSCAAVTFWLASSVPGSAIMEFALSECSVSSPSGMWQLECSPFWVLASRFCWAVEFSVKGAISASVMGALLANCTAVGSFLLGVAMGLTPGVDVCLKGWVFSLYLNE